MPFVRCNTDVQKRKDRGSESEGNRKRSSLASMPWTPSQLAISGRYLALEGADFWFPLTLDENWIKDHLRLPMLHMVMDADLSRFKTIVLERPGQLWVLGCQQHNLERLLPMRWQVGSLGVLTARVTLWFKAPTPKATKLLGLTSTLTLQAVP
jgi:hypothetical protein